MRRLFLVITLAWCVLAGTLWYSWPDRSVHLVFCDVGQGDAILIWQGFSQVLIDSGRVDNQVLECLAEYLPFWDRQLELAVATHADSDHIGGFPAVMDRYLINYLLIEPVGKKTGDFLDFHEAVSRKIEQGSHLVLPSVGQQLMLAPTLTFTTLSPQERHQASSPFDPNLPERHLWDSALDNDQEVISFNDRSIVLLLRVGEIEVLLTGDLEEGGEQALLTQGLLSQLEVLKVGHHGSKTSTSERFLETIRPEIAVVSSGKNNKYGHPAPEVLQKLEQKGAKILRTDEMGSLHLIIQGGVIRKKEE